MKNFNTDKTLSIAVIGVGGAGNNALTSVMAKELKDITLIAANTDAQVLQNIDLENKKLLGEELTRGLGAGGDPKIGAKAAEESFDYFKQEFDKFDLVFIVSGMGGGTGTGASPVIARAAKESNALTISIVTTPFAFEGGERISNAKSGLLNLERYSDSTIVISNDKVLHLNGKLPLNKAFEEANSVVILTIMNIQRLLTRVGIINLDFADVKRTLTEQGRIHVGTGQASGDYKVKEATQKSISSKLFESGVVGAERAIVHIAGGPNLTLDDASEAMDIIKKQAGKSLDILFGVSQYEELTGGVIVTVIASGFKSSLHDDTVLITEEDQVIAPKAKRKFTSEAAEEETIEELLKNSVIDFDSEDLDLEDLGDFEDITFHFDSDTHNIEAVEKMTEEKEKEESFYKGDDALPSFLRRDK